MPLLLTEALSYNDIPLAAAYRDAPAHVQDAIAEWWPLPRWGEAAAIVFLESGNDPLAHNDRGEDSRGLFQVNLRAHPSYATRDLYDPRENARAAYEVYQRAGYSWRPWYNAATKLGLL